LKIFIFDHFRPLFDPLAQICEKLHLYGCMGIALRSSHKKFHQKTPIGSKVMSQKLKNKVFYVVKCAIFETLLLSGEQVVAKMINWN